MRFMTNYKIATIHKNKIDKTLGKLTINFKSLLLTQNKII